MFNATYSGFTENFQTAHMISIKEHSHYGINTNIITITIQGTDDNNGFDELSQDLFNLGWFGTCRDRVFSDLKSFLKNNGIYINDSRNIYFITGHSLGAAAANLLEASLLDDYGCEPSQIYGYNFACPLTLNLINNPLPWNRWKYNCIFNLNSDRDPLPHLGKACRFGEESSIRRDEGVEERLQDMFGKKIKNFLGIFDEHDVDVYMAAVLNDSCLDVSKDDGKAYTVSLKSSYSDLVNGDTPTSSSCGAETGGGASAAIGRYYVKASVSKDSIYKAAVSEAAVFEILSEETYLNGA